MRRLGEYSKIIDISGEERERLSEAEGAFGYIIRLVPERIREELEDLMSEAIEKLGKEWDEEEWEDGDYDIYVWLRSIDDKLYKIEGTILPAGENKIELYVIAYERRHEDDYEED